MELSAGSSPRVRNTSTITGTTSPTGTIEAQTESGGADLPV